MMQQGANQMSYDVTPVTIKPSISHLYDNFGLALYTYSRALFQLSSLFYHLLD